MSENPSEQEPSIEEILASIRQIISDDDDNEDAQKEKIVESPIREKADDVLELTEEDLEEPDEPEDNKIDEMMEVEMVDRDEPEENEEDEEDTYIPEVNNMLNEIRAEADRPKPMPSEILSSNTQAAALSSISKLTRKMPIHSSRSYDGVTLEDIVREMLHPMLREWMDDNLPPMVERTVQKELEKLARRAMDD